MELTFDRPKNAGGVITLSASERIPGLEEYLLHEDTRAGLYHYAAHTVVDYEFVLAIEALRVDGVLPLPVPTVAGAYGDDGYVEWLLVCDEPLPHFQEIKTWNRSPWQFRYRAESYGHARLMRDVVLSGWGQELPA